jgi:hypothetical protein
MGNKTRRGNKTGRRHGKNSKKRILVKPPFNVYELLEPIYPDPKVHVRFSEKNEFNHFRMLLGMSGNGLHPINKSLFKKLKEAFPKEIPDGCCVICFRPQFYEEHITYVSYDNTGGLFAFEIRQTFGSWDYKPIIKKEVNPEPWKYYLDNHVDEHLKKEWRQDFYDYRKKQWNLKKMNLDYEYRESN